MNTSNLKPFRLEDFKSNDETPVVYKTGQRAFIAVHPHPESIDNPVAAFFAETRTSDTYSANGCYRNNQTPSLFFAPRKKVVPLDLSDVDRMRWLKASETATEYHSVARCFKDGVQLGGSKSSWSFDGLMTCGWLYAEKITGPWHRCEKEVDA